MVRWLLVIILIVTGCQRDPAGEDLIEYYRGLGLLQEDTLRPVHLENSYSDLPNGLGSDLVLGIDSDYESRVLIKFFIPDTGSGDIDSLRLVLVVDDDLKNEKVDFEIRLITTDWDEAEVRWLAASDGMKWGTPGGDYGDSILYSGSIEKDSIIVDIDPNLFTKVKDLFGFILLPKSGGPLAFAAGKARLYLVSNGEQTTFNLIGDSFIIKCLHYPEEGEYFLGSGFTFRNYLRFPIDSTYQEFWLARADLRLKVLDHRSMRDSISYGLRSLKEEFWGIKTEIRGYEFTHLPIADSTFTIDVLTIINYWIEHPDSNFGGFLALYPEDSDLTRLEIDPDSLLLILYLVTSPQRRF
ncbi:hypothetical protein DRP53_05140 [candidate division WOR-3 bacterium]|uniref:DNRLRE domain-containing protein n=1 Tax=candidate division WOR-3 bacterium TaxID=2052148 RepID=A0A660SIP6_UNCW3|nr:MAG: hypothetical protein DRP53_05140 [candidate division WOR-3 bacterium]